MTTIDIQYDEDLGNTPSRDWELGSGEEAVANGAVRPLYRWTQEPDDLTAVVLLPPGTEKRRVVCVFRPQSLVVGLRGEPPIIDAPLRGRVKVEECVWQLQDSHRLVLQMHKVAPPTPRAQGGTVDACWWPSLVPASSLQARQSSWPLAYGPECACGFTAWQIRSGRVSSFAACSTQCI